MASDSEIRAGVGEHSISDEVAPARGGGVYGRENVGMSSKNLGENPKHRKTKVSWATQIDPGLVGPKASPLSGGVTDGQLVNIPALLLISDGGTEKRRLGVILVTHVGCE